jgi:hypothetical protein
MLAEVIGARLSGADEQAVIACDNGKDRGVLHIGAGEIWIGEARDRTLTVDTAVPQVYLLRVAEGECRVEIGGQSLAGPADPGRRVELELGLQRGYTADSECHWGRVAIGFEADGEPADAAPPAKAVARGSGRGGAREAQTREAPRQQTDAKRKAARR